MPLFSEFRFKYSQHHNGLRDHDPQQQVPAGVLPDQLLRQRQECVLPGTVQYNIVQNSTPRLCVARRAAAAGRHAGRPAAGPCSAAPRGTPARRSAAREVAARRPAAAEVLSISSILYIQQDNPNHHDTFSMQFVKCKCRLHQCIENTQF